jgi:GTP pyrophosphokinase
MRRRTTPRADAAARGRHQLLQAARAAYAPPEVLAIERAYEQAARLHAGQRRHSGDPYITHPLAVATLTAQLRSHPTVVCAALLHDVLQLSPCTAAELYTQFGTEVTDLVVTFNRLDQDPRLNDETRCGEAASDYSDDVLTLKILDRLHNMRTIQHIRIHKQHARSRQTLQVMAPLAETLGMTAVSSELEQLADAVLHPKPNKARVSSQILSTTTRMLPAATRPRWQQEWAAELSALPTRRARARFALQTLRGTPHLTMTLRRPIEPN